MAKESKPVLVLEDLEEMEGVSLEEQIAESEVSMDDSPFLEEADPVVDDLEESVPELSSDDDIEAAIELEPKPEKELPKSRTRSRSKTPPKEPTTPVPEISLDADDFPDVADPEGDGDPIEALIRPVGDIPEWMTIVVYGKNGTGKTTFGASGGKTLVLEVEKDGTFSVRDRGSEAKKYPVKSWDDFEKIYWYLKKNPGKYEIVCIDTLTRLAELCTRSVVLDKKAKGAELLDKDIVKITLPQRGDISQRMTFWLNAFAELPCHKVWLCQEAAGSDDKDVANVDVYPDLSRKMRIYVCSDATIIGRTEIKMKEEVIGGVMKEVPQYIMRVAPSSSYLSKDRTKVLGAGLKNPKIDKLIEKVYA